MKKRRKRIRMADAPPVLSIREECAMLATLETFDPQAFVGNTDIPQHLCNFILTLSLIYNDCKDAIQAHVALAGARPEGRPQKTRAWGATSGAQFHVFRAVAGLVHELFDLISDNRAILNDPFFISLLRQLHPKSRRAWQALANVACDAAPTDQLTKKLSRLRHKILSHYDPSEIFRGYRQHFLGPTRRDDRAYVSRGDTMRATRFYFADAAGTGYLDLLVGSDQADELKSEIGDVIDQINHGVMMIVRAFIQQRGGQFRRESEP